MIVEKQSARQLQQLRELLCALADDYTNEKIGFEVFVYSAAAISSDYKGLVPKLTTNEQREALLGKAITEAIVLRRPVGKRIHVPSQLKKEADELATLVSERLIHADDGPYIREVPKNAKRSRPNAYEYVARQLAKLGISTTGHTIMDWRKKLKSERDAKLPTPSGPVGEWLHKRRR